MVVLVAAVNEKEDEDNRVVEPRKASGMWLAEQTHFDSEALKPPTVPHQPHYKTHCPWQNPL